MPPSTAPKTNILRRFRRNRRGSAAVEFALVAPIFFAVLFAIIELALVFFASQILETVTQDTARLIMTGQAQTASFTAAQFKTAVCGKLTVMFDCSNGVSIDVQSYPAFAGVNIAEPIDAFEEISFHRRNISPARPATSSWCGCSTMAGVRHRARLQSHEYRRQQASADRDRCIPKRAFTPVRPRAMKPMRTLFGFACAAAFELRGNNSGVAAVEFAMIIPLMGMLLVGTNEFSAGVAVDRKVTLMARTLSDLTSQNTSVTDAQADQFLQCQRGDHDALFVDAGAGDDHGTLYQSHTLKARVQWSKGTEAHSPGDIIEIPAALKVGGTYLIYSEVKYKYVPSVAWFINKVNGITLSDVSYTRPRQGLCVMYGTSVCTTT